VKREKREKRKEMKNEKLEMKINLTGFLLVPELVCLCIQAGLSACK
jgi:hypothetical protein